MYAFLIEWQSAERVSFMTLCESFECELVTDGLEKVSKEPVFPYFSNMKQSRRLHLVECPRDVIQGYLPHFTHDKLVYYRTLLRVGFDTLDMGSFVSPKAIPAMADTAHVLSQLEDEGIWDQTQTRGLVIVANERGCKEAVTFESVKFIGFR